MPGLQFGSPHHAARPIARLATAAALIVLTAHPAAAQTAEPPVVRPGFDDAAKPALSAAGGRAAENAVRQAADAFGTVVGREAVGLYDPELVRGFSPVAAGNVRVDGLYFDAVITPTDRTSSSTAILVGPSAIGSVFPAPTGIVDFRLRLPGDTLAASTLVSGTSYGEVRAELDAAIPVTARLSLGLGTTLEWLREGDGRRDDKFEGAAIARWRPTDRLTLTPFISVAVTPFDDVTPVYVPAGPFLPPRLPRLRRIGPDWAFRNDVELNAGAITDWDFGGGWAFKAGLFRSQSRKGQEAANLILDVQPDGRARQEVAVDPPVLFRSTSGEARLSRTFADGPRTHRLVASFRGRDALRRFDGSDRIDLGPTTVDRLNRSPRLPLSFGEQQRDRFRQWLAGVAYQGRWEGVGEVNAGVQYTDYLKRIGLPGEAPTVTATQTPLYNVNAALTVTRRLELYGGYVTGLEESGVAPPFAINRNEALPAITTRQADLGLRYGLSDGLRVIAGVFEIAKPYFSIDPEGRFGELGQVRNRGVEASVAGALTRSLSVNIGGLLLDPRVSGAAVEQGVAGPRAVGGIARRLEASADWRPGFLPGASLDVALSYRSPETATVDNAVTIPDRTLVALGGRYQFRLRGAVALLRVQAENLFDTQGFELVDAGAYQLIWPRRVQAYVTVDF